MNDQEFNQRAYSNPRDGGEDFKAALDARPDRQRLVSELQALEYRLEQTLQDIAIPANLEDRLKRNGTQSSSNGENTAETHKPVPAPRRHWQRFSRPAAIAASLLIALSLSFTVLTSRPTAADMALGNSLLNHVHAESRFYNVDNNIPWSSASEVMQQTGASFASFADVANEMNLTFAEFCRLMGNDKRGTHLVIRGEHGPVSIMFINHHPIRGKVELQDSELRGEVVPVEDGFLAIFGSPDEPIARIRTRFQRQLTWSI
ncbi:DUF3379 family protein [Pseudohongiella nitratireducens]|uniref:DUF3379 family protein n=1 Tax=Pseudohongiella nitratireducens TaxID=1768907 RepID=UPI0030EDCA45|tara:strand:- start:669 stop:1448 length:780 start_codon:yes stop_codon:yes gene_type:complete